MGERGKEVGREGGQEGGRGRKRREILICFGLLSPFSSLQNMPRPYLQMIKIILS